MSPVKSASKKASAKSAKGTAAKSRPSKGFSDDEKAAMRERARELRMSSDRAAGEEALLKQIAAMPEPDRSMAKRLHAIITACAPGLLPKTWYGMPAYANQDGKIICFFQAAAKFKARYATFGFSDEAQLDEGAMWPVTFALKELSAAEEARIGALLKKAVSQGPSPQTGSIASHTNCWQQRQPANSRSSERPHTVHLESKYRLNGGIRYAGEVPGALPGTATEASKRRYLVPSQVNLYQSKILGALPRTDPEFRLSASPPHIA